MFVAIVISSVVNVLGDQYVIDIDIFLAVDHVGVEAYLEIGDKKTGCPVMVWAYVSHESSGAQQIEINDRYIGSSVEI